MISRNGVLSRFEDLNVWKRGGERAAHKPLLFLEALGHTCAEDDDAIANAHGDGILNRSGFPGGS